MRITAQIAAQLAALTDTFDNSEIDIVRSLTRLADQVRLAVPSYLGLSVAIGNTDPHFDFDAMDDTGGLHSIGSSFMIPASDVLDRAIKPSRVSHTVELVLYAATPGAFVDLAADLVWLTTQPADRFTLDQHLEGPRSMNTAGSASVLNQAIGVLIGRGHTPQGAERTIADQAASAGMNRDDVAAAILDSLPHPRGFPNSEPDS